MIYTPSFIKIGSAAQATLSCCLRNLNGSNVGTADGKEL
jgi:hypothetical protein